MEQVFKKSFAIITLPTLLIAMTACSATGTTGIDNEGDTRRVNNVVWQNQVDKGINAVLANPVPQDQSRLVFIRPNSNAPKQTSANIAIDDRFQVSLHPSNYTAVTTCAGQKTLSVYATGFKSNNLLANNQTYTLKGAKTHFFYVEMTKEGQGSIKHITPDSAKQLLTDKRYQSHQISRVTPDCSQPTVVDTKPAVIIPVATVPVVPNRQVVINKDNASIDLEVLFATDKAVVRSEYYNKIIAVADFMKRHSTVTAVIEGHTDSRGDEDYNQALSQRRADAVRDVLIQQFDIDAKRIHAVGYGETKPRASNDTATGRQENRRVMAVIDNFE